MPPRFLLQAGGGGDPRLRPSRSGAQSARRDVRRALRAASRPARAPELTPAAIDTLASKVRDAVAHRVYPAYDALLRVLAGQIAHAQEEPGVWRLPDGDAYYAYELRCQTSTDLVRRRDPSRSGSSWRTS